MKNALGVLFVSLICVACAVQKAVPVKERPNMDSLNNQGVSIGDPINSPPQLYPKSAYDIGQEGWVLLLVDIDAQGETHNIRAIDYSPTKAFVKYAIHKADAAVYSPVLVNGVPTEVKGHYLIVNFSLDEKLNRTPEKNE